jgi:GNAT superfamily N-acetyltransferase
MATSPQSAPHAVRMREIVNRHDPALPAAYALLRDTFARNERVTLNDWRASLREREEEVWTDYAWHLVVAESRGAVLGLATGTYLGSVNAAIIGYLAISPDLRSGGLGTLLRRRLRGEFERDARRRHGRTLGGVVGEVSADNPWLRRLARHPNVLVLDLPYYQPRLHLLELSRPYVLYYESCDRRRADLPMLEVRRLLYAIWREGYRLARPLQYRAFRRILRSLDGRRRIGAHPDY